MARESHTQVYCLPVSVGGDDHLRDGLSYTSKWKVGNGTALHVHSPVSSFQDFGRREGTTLCLTMDLLFPLSTSRKPPELEGMGFLPFVLNILLHHMLYVPLIILNLFLSLGFWGGGRVGEKSASDEKKVSGLEGVYQNE